MQADRQTDRQTRTLVTVLRTPPGDEVGLITLSGKHNVKRTKQVVITPTLGQLAGQDIVDVLRENDNSNLGRF